MIFLPINLACLRKQRYFILRLSACTPLPGGGGVFIYKMGINVPPYVKKKGAYRADQTEKVGAFRAERTVKVVPLKLIGLGKTGAFTKSGCF